MASSSKRTDAGDRQPCPPVPPPTPVRLTGPLWKPSLVTLRVDGMTCQQCSNRIRSTLAAVDGIAGARVSLDEATIEVLFDSTRITPARIAERIRAAAAGSPRTYRVLEVGPIR